MLIPEQLFNNPETEEREEKEAEGISAAKAIALASQQGQKVFIITKDNYNEVLPNLNHGEDVMLDIRNAINAGKEVTVHQSAISFHGWNGSGYIILDPDTGTGAYMIGGGADGAILMIISALLIIGIAPLFIEINPVAFAGLLVLSIGLLTTAYGFINKDSTACQIGIETALVGAQIIFGAFAFAKVIQASRATKSLEPLFDLLSSDPILFTFLGGATAIGNSFGRDYYKNRVCGWIK